MHAFPGEEFTLDMSVRDELNNPTEGFFTATVPEVSTVPNVFLWVTATVNLYYNLHGMKKWQISK